VKIIPRSFFTCVFTGVVALCLSIVSCAQPLNQKKGFTLQDSLRGSITPERAWWDADQYKIFVEPDYTAKTIKGTVTIIYNVKDDKGKTRMQIDLQEPMKIDMVTGNDGQTVKLMKGPGAAEPIPHQPGRQLKFTRVGNVYYIEDAPRKNKTESITIQFSGSPRIAANPPWDGGWIFTKDAKNRPWMTVACQGLGASVWYPCKDHQSDEPDNGALIEIKAPNDLAAVANGRLIGKKEQGGHTIWSWQVKSPINNYNIVPYIGHYTTWRDNYAGERGELSLDYWVLDYNLEKAQKQFGRDVKPMLKCFEYWFGPYPFYDDGYKLVESPHLGMEHQSAVAYGNHYKDGYLGMDLSGSGWGKQWDYIIIHESGHEWFANNISTNDIADMWVHEGFTDYSEVLFVECQYGKNAGDAYAIGLRRNIQNDIPIIGHYGVNQEGSGDMYAKGANMLHTIRQVIDNDSLFRKILRGLNSVFYHKTVDSKDVEAYMSRESGKDLSKIFDQYLRTIDIPVLEYKFTQRADNPDNYTLEYRWTNCVKGFNMPVRISFANKPVWLPATTDARTLNVSAEEKNSMPSELAVDKNFYIKVKKI
jgi:aminopeptidase N